MGARLIYGKVIDRQLFLIRGGKVTPGLDSEVVLSDEPGKAGAFLVLRAWSEDHGSFTEQWRIEAPGGIVVYESLPRELHMPTTTHVERLEDEVVDLDLDFAADDYAAVFSLDEIEVARLRFPVRLNGAGPPA